MCIWYDPTYSLGGELAFSSPDKLLHDPFINVALLISMWCWQCSSFSSIFRSFHHGFFSISLANVVVRKWCPVPTPFLFRSFSNEPNLQLNMRVNLQRYWTTWWNQLKVLDANGMIWKEFDGPGSLWKTHKHTINQDRQWEIVKKKDLYQVVLFTHSWAWKWPGHKKYWAHFIFPLQQMSYIRQLSRPDRL